MIIVFAHLDHFHHVVVQRRRLKLARFFTQVEDRQARGEILIIRRITGDQVCGRLDNGFVDVRGLDTVRTNVERSSTWEIETLCSPSAAQSRTRWILSRSMRSVLLLRLSPADSDSCMSYLFWNSFRSSFMQTTCSTGSCLEHYI